MKIEIAESIMMSWLRHAKNCQVVQMNWKASDNWEFYNEVLVNEILDKTQNKFQTELDFDLFKQNRSTSQILKQGEIDVLGIEINENKLGKIYGVDVAFHSAGLNYKNAVAKVVTKMIRTAALIIAYFDSKSGEIIFASPKINNVVLKPLNEVISQLNEYFRSEWSLDFNFLLIANDDFEEKVFNPIMVLSETVADTSELFMRSVQMYRLFERPNIQGGEKRRTTKRNLQKVEIESIKGFEEIKIGALVRSTFPELAKSNMLDNTDILNLTNDDFCKTTFNLNYPFLKKIDPIKDISEQRKVGGYFRYYAPSVNIHGVKYFFCQEWIEHSKSFYIRWLEKIKTKNNATPDF